MPDTEEAITEDELDPLETADDAPETPPADAEEPDAGAVDEGDSEAGQTPVDADVEPPEPVAAAPQREAATGAITPASSPVPANSEFATAHPFAVEGFYPVKFKDYAVAADGQDLSDPRFEDPASEEAADYFTDLVNRLGGDEDAANREYDRQVTRYETAKGSYENHVTQLEEQASRNAVTAVQQQVNEQGNTLVSQFDTLAEGLGAKVIEAFHGKAVGVIAGGLNALTQNYIASGLSPKRAEARATADFAAEKALYKDAVDLAIADDPIGFARLVLETAGVKPGTSKPIAASDAPPRPMPPPMAGGGGRGGQPERVAARIVPTEEERQAAEAIGKDPVEFAKSHRERFGLNGAAPAAAGAGGRR